MTNLPLLVGIDINVVSIYFGVSLTEQLQTQIAGISIQHFGISALKNWQIKIILAALEGRNTFIIQPTGSGKSLCFQIMPFITGKVTVVLTPTISLMKDQCCSLEKNKISTTYVGSSQIA